MTNQSDVDATLQMVQKLCNAYDLIFEDVLKGWGVEVCLDQLKKVWNQSPPYAENFQKIWFDMLNQNLQSAIWLCLYYRFRLDLSQKDATKKADDVLRDYVKGQKNAV